MRLRFLPARDFQAIGPSFYFNFFLLFWFVLLVLGVGVAEPIFIELVIRNPSSSTDGTSESECTLLGLSKSCSHPWILLQPYLSKKRAERLTFWLS